MIVLILIRLNLSAVHNKEANNTVNNNNNSMFQYTTQSLIHSNNKEVSNSVVVNSLINQHYNPLSNVLSRVSLFSY